MLSSQINYFKLLIKFHKIFHLEFSVFSIENFDFLFQILYIDDSMGAWKAPNKV